jgi:DnaK suppressor protein
MTEETGLKGHEQPYDPKNDSVYMSPAMCNFFKEKLENLVSSILEKEKKISLSLMDDPVKEPDLNDRGTREETAFTDFVYQEHEEQLRQDALSALQRIKDGLYGYCEVTGQEIGVKRLMIVPTTRHCVKAQQKIESDNKY